MESKTQQSLRFNLQNQGSSVGEHHTDPTYLLVACRRAKGHVGIVQAILAVRLSRYCARSCHESEPDCRGDENKCDAEVIKHTK